MKNKMLFRRGLALLTICSLSFMVSCGGKANVVSRPSSSKTTSSVSADVSSLVSSLASSSSVASSVASSITSSIARSSSVGSTSRVTSSTTIPSNFKVDGSTALPSGAIVFKVESYGAIGDGTTDDTIAVERAIGEAMRESDDVYKIIQFKANTTYRFANSNLTQLFAVDQGSKIIFSGNNTRILLKAPMVPASITNSSDIKIMGFTFDYSPKPFVLGTVTGKNLDENSMTFQTDGDLGLSGNTYSTTSGSFFALPNRIDERAQFFIRNNGISYEKLGTNIYKVYFALDSTTKSRVTSESIGDQFILPYAGVENIGAAFDIIGNKGAISIVNCNVESAPTFGFGVRDNKGVMFFTNIVLKPSANSKIHLVEWRDGFHVKDNIKPITWDNCYIGPIGDDAFNLSDILDTVTSVQADKQTFTMYPDESASTTTYQDVNVGDDFIIYNLATGKDIGEGVVAESIDQMDSGHITIKADKAFPSLDVGDKVGLYKNANPGSIIENCYVEGTVRVRSQVTFENTQFNIFWLMICNETAIEGPIPKNVTFNKCVFTSYQSDPGAFVQIFTQDQNGNPADYKCKNIVFNGCTFLKGKMSVQAGNDVTVK